MAKYQLTREDKIDAADDVFSKLEMINGLSDAEIVSLWLDIFVGE